MGHPTLLLLIKFKSALNLDEVIQVVDTRADEFRALKGLQQKYYLQDPATGEFAGLYHWASEDDFLEYRDSELRASIASAYQVIGEPRIEVFRVLKTLRDLAAAGFAGEDIRS